MWVLILKGVHDVIILWWWPENNGAPHMDDTTLCSCNKNRKVWMGKDTPNWRPSFTSRHWTRDRRCCGLTKVWGRNGMVEEEYDPAEKKMPHQSGDVGCSLSVKRHMIALLGVVCSCSTVRTWSKKLVWVYSFIGSVCCCWTVSLCASFIFTKKRTEGEIRSRKLATLQSSLLTLIYLICCYIHGAADRLLGGRRCHHCGLWVEKNHWREYIKYKSLLHNHPWFRSIDELINSVWK